MPQHLEGSENTDWIDESIGFWTQRIYETTPPNSCVEVLIFNTSKHDSLKIKSLEKGNYGQVWVGTNARQLLFLEEMKIKT